MHRVGAALIFGESMEDWCDGSQRQHRNQGGIRHAVYGDVNYLQIGQMSHKTMACVASSIVEVY
jgi:hypothetical protein